MSKIDLKKEFKELYTAPKKEPKIVELPPLNYLLLDGQGQPQEQEFQDAVSSVYPVAYTLKFMIKINSGIDYGVMPLEVQWNVDHKRKVVFKWTIMMLQPKYVTAEAYAEALERVRRKTNPPSLSKLRLETVHEGTCAQIMFVGPYEGMNAVKPIFAEFTRRNGYRLLSSSTHDIYLNSILKAKPENLKTIIRYPVGRIDSPA